MEVANCRLKLNKFGSDVPIKDVTPAEAMFLHILHGPENGGLTFGEEFTKIEITGQALIKEGEKLRSRTDAEELRRLTAKYSGARNKKNEPVINSIWPDRFNPKLPQTFKEIKWVEIQGGAGDLAVAPLNYATGNVKA